MKIIECPRDAMQGIKTFIPTDLKIEYINQLLKVGYDTLDFGSFVSPRAIPQLSDTAEVLQKLDLTNTNTKLLAILGNTKGAELASKFSEIDYLGFPYSLSPTFLKLNINSTLAEAQKTIDNIQNICIKTNKKLVLYFSLAFANNYGDDFTNDDLINEIERLKKLGITTFSMADTVGLANYQSIYDLFNIVLKQFSNLEIGLHLHTTEKDWYEKIDAAFLANCRRFDSVINGFGGCPMSGSELVGNLSTNNLIYYFEKNNIKHNLNLTEFEKANQLANNIFNNYK